MFILRRMSWTTPCPPWSFLFLSSFLWTLLGMVVAVVCTTIACSGRLKGGIFSHLPPTDARKALRSTPLGGSVHGTLTCAEGPTHKVTEYATLKVESPEAAICLGTGFWLDSKTGQTQWNRLLAYWDWSLFTERVNVTVFTRTKSWHSQCTWREI